MGKKKSSSKSKAVFVDEEVLLSVIENQEFMAMRAAQKIWPALTTMEDQLCELVSDGLIQDKGFVDWKTPGQHQVPTLGPGEIVLFVSFIHAGLYLPTSTFLHRFLNYFEISFLLPMLSSISLFLFIFAKLSLEFLLPFLSFATSSI
jgi:hypothetical protein